MDGVPIQLLRSTEADTAGRESFYYNAGEDGLQFRQHAVRRISGNGDPLIDDILKLRLDAQAGCTLPTRNELKTLARLRLKEAESLYRSGFYGGSEYLCGYVVEFALKARICKVLNLQAYPADELKIAKTHDFDVLKLLAGLKKDLGPGGNKELWENWTAATKWRPELRYQMPAKNSRETAKLAIESIKGRNGVLTWLAKRW